MSQPPKPPPEKITDRVVLLVISAGLIGILLSIIAGLFGWFESKSQAPLPNWAENVLVAIATASALKLGDALSTLVALSSGRHVMTLGTQLGNAGPADSGGPAGTERDPLHVAGAQPGERPVSTQPKPAAPAPAPAPAPIDPPPPPPPPGQEELP